ncbi:MAG TPA: family 43 glycosylhydrolase, partial [Acidimicrobiales bacterium]|nr:family 43 glycosylhydrolase [Acidimicrobiales bacterium]
MSTVAGVVLLVAVTSLDVAVASRDHRDHLELAATSHRLSALQGDLSALRAQTAQTEITRARRQAAIDVTDQATTTAETDLEQATAKGALQQIDIATLGTCLNGVAAAQSDLAAGNSTGAVSAISAVSAACLTVDGTASGLAYPFDFPDPDVLPVNGNYYAFATNSAAGNIQVIESPDLVHWVTLGDALPKLPPWAAPSQTWAPAVIPIAGGYV